MPTINFTQERNSKLGDIVLFSAFVHQAGPHMAPWTPIATDHLKQIIH